MQSSQITQVPYLTGLTSPIQLRSWQDGTGHHFHYVADQTGVIYRVDGAQTTSILDIKDWLPVLDGYDERGLLDFVFYPGDYSRLFLFYSSKRDYADKPKPVPVPSGGSVENTPVALERAKPYFNCLSEFRVAADGTILKESELVILRILKYLPYHNGGRICFGPDRMLYIGIGDAGPQKDPQNHAQDLSVLYGKILRIDVSESGYCQCPEQGSTKDNQGNTIACPTGLRPCAKKYPYYYSIPADNPFVNQPSARAEIWALGLRNPWGMSFDNQGRLFVADVGYETMEEIDIVVRGSNLGWNIKEGTLFTGFQPTVTGLIDPIYEYRHEGQFAKTAAVIGGYVLGDGTYLFGDYSGVIMRIKETGSISVPSQTWQLISKQKIKGFIRAFSTDDIGNLYLLYAEAPGVKAGVGKIDRLIVS
jgi:hypothetical protein